MCQIIFYFSKYLSFLDPNKKNKNDSLSGTVVCKNTCPGGCAGPLKNSSLTMQTLECAASVNPFP